MSCTQREVFWSVAGEIRHDGKSMKLEFAAIAITEERCDEEFGVRGALEVAMTLECRDRDCVGAYGLANRGHEKRAYPRG